MEKVDCVVVGAGWYGLGAAKQFHCTQPTASLVVFETESSLGGTWADHRLYPGLKSNNLWGTYQYPDFPMTTDRFGVKEREHIPGTVVNQYLKAYASEFGITDLIRFNTKVTVAEHQEDGGWILTTTKTEQDAAPKPSTIFARRLIIASGLTSDPLILHYEGQETFGAPIFHTKEFKKYSDTLKTAKSVTIFGATKSGYDAAYVYAKAGVNVNWVIRSTGHGPGWIAPAFVTPLKKWIEKLANVRALSWFSPCIFADDGYSAIRNFYHGTAIGRAVTNQFWKTLGNDVLTLNGYDSHPETAKLKPWTEAMTTGTSFSLLNYDEDFFELVKTGDKIKIYVSEVDHLSPGKVHLTDGTTFDSDAILANTGWKIVPPMEFLPEGIDKELGLPHIRIEKGSDTPVDPNDLGNQHALLDKADKEILSRFPRLKDQYVWNKNFVPITKTKAVSVDEKTGPNVPLTPYMLHHFIVPASERFLRTRDIAFIGMVSNFSNIITAHLQGLWISAYFQGKLVIDPASALGDAKKMEDLRYQTVLHNRFGKWRYPVDWGNRNPSFIFDAVPYLDILCKDMGLETHRKGGKGFMAEIYDPYGPEDYENVNEEWEAKFGDNKAKSDDVDVGN